MPFKIPRLEINQASQKDLNFLPDSGCLFSQLDSQCYSNNSQNLRDSAIELSYDVQHGKHENHGFWSSIKSFNEPDHTSISVKSASAQPDSVGLVIREIGSTISDLDLNLGQIFACIDDNDRTSENINNVGDQLQQSINIFRKCSEDYSKLKNISESTYEKLHSLHTYLSKLISSSQTPLYNLDLKQCVPQIKMECFSANLDFLISMAKQRIQSTNKLSQTRIKKQITMINENSSAEYLYRQSWRYANNRNATKDHETVKHALPFNKDKFIMFNHNILSLERTPGFVINFSDKTVQDSHLIHKENQEHLPQNVRCAQTNSCYARRSNIRRKLPPSSPMPKSSSPNPSISIPTNSPSPLFSFFCPESSSSDKRMPSLLASPSKPTEIFCEYSSDDCEDGECISLSSLILMTE